MIWRWETINKWIAGRGYVLGAEIGVKEGRFIEYMLANNPELSMYAVDPWEGQRGATEDYLEWDWVDIYKAYRTRIRPHFNRVTEHRKYSKDAARYIPDGLLDFVFIDAQHDYDSVLKDIDIWLPKVKNGGMISGHDYNPDKFPGVCKAVHERFLAPMTGENDCWVVYL